MALLRSRIRGIIHLLGSSEGNLPEVEFDGGEGPEQIMDQIQNFAVPSIRKAIHPVGPRLLWQELDVRAGRLHRHAHQLENDVEFELCPDDRGIELLLSSDRPETGATGEGEAGAVQAGPGRVWVPLSALGEPGRRQLAVLGWTVSKPRFFWRYVEIGQTPRLEMTWSCDDIYPRWADEIRRGAGVVKCRLGNGRTCQLNPTRHGALFYRGHTQLSNDAWLPARWRLTLAQPLVVVTQDEAPSRLIDDDVVVTSEALDFRAVLADRTTRLICDEDLDQRFEAEVLTPEEVLLPDEIPGGTIPGLGWTLAVERGAAPGPASAFPDDGNVRMHPATSRYRRWILKPRDEDGGSWGQVDWDSSASLCFALGSVDPGEAPELTRIENRKATVGWRIETSAEQDDELLCFTIPHWVPMEELEHFVPPHQDRPFRDHGFDYASEVRARLGGLEERFTIDPSSEMSANRVFLDPRRWRFYDEAHGDLKEAEALGEVSGYVRWRRPALATHGEGPFPGSDVSPTDWAGGSAPILLIRRSPRRDREEDVRHWGGLYVPEPIPWEALQEVRPEMADGDLVLTPRSSLPALWISLWGFLCRYDRHEVTFTQRESQEVTAWIARTGLELFPQEDVGREGAGRGFLMRSFAPVYAVRDVDPRVFSLESAVPRPVLRLGRDLHEAGGPRSLEIGGGTYVRFQVTPSGQVPDAFGPGRIPGTPLHLSAEPGRRTVWLALEERHEDRDTEQPSGYLLSWDAPQGWRFRGFFAHHDATVSLGRVRLPGRSEVHSRVLLGDESRAGRRAFRLTLDGDGHHWSESTPEAVADQVTSGMVDAWERRYFARDQLPPPLADYEMRIVRQPVNDGPRVFELLEREDVFDFDPPPGIRVWEPQEGADEELLAGVRMLSVDEPEPVEEEAPAEDSRVLVKKKLLKADDDDDDF